MTRVFYTHISKLNKDLASYKGRVSEYRYQKAIKYKNVDDALLGIGAELLLAKYLGRVPRYEIDQFGKPFGESVSFNFSHSGNIAVCAVSENAVGADVEKVRRVDLEIARKRFCKREYEDIINSANPTETFFEYWVKKESYIKALGTGFKTPLCDFDVENIMDFKFYTHSIEGYKICVCCKDSAEFYEKEL